MHASPVPAHSSGLPRGREHVDAKKALLTWHGHVLKTRWQTPAHVKADFGTASILKDGRVVFNIAGNKCRVVDLAPLFPDTA